jgi:hypothetical protein
MKISVTSKLDGIKSWSLEALDTCPGSIGSDGALVPACSGCYATTGRYIMPTTKAPRIHNKEDWRRPAWTTDMVAALQGERFFRWFDSGDVYALPLAKKILAVMQQTPDTKHWLPTRMAKFPKFEAVLSEMRALPNVAVRFSSDSVSGDFTPGVHGSTIFSSQRLPRSVFICGAYNREGKCDGCRACWDKSINVIAYPAHGRKMTKVIQISGSR